MSQHLDYFSDMLTEGEQICAAVAGPGSATDGTTVWFQFAATETRILVVELHLGPTGTYMPVQRLVADSGQIHMERYPKTDRSLARLELLGFEVPVIMVEIDRPDVFPNIEPLIVAWGGRLGGAGTIRPALPPVQAESTIDRKTLLIVAMTAVGLLVFVCMCGGVVAGIIAGLQGIKP
jgi:hypothetical protein